MSSSGAESSFVYSGKNEDNTSCRNKGWADLLAVNSSYWDNLDLKFLSYDDSNILCAKYLTGPMLIEAKAMMLAV